MFKSFVFSYKVGAAMVAASWDAISLWQTTTAFSSSSSQSHKWVWLASTIVAFIAFCVIVLRGWYSEFNRAEALEEKHPTVIASPNNDGKVAWLSIKNTGKNEAEFGATITFFGITLNPDEKKKSYDGRWRAVPPNVVLRRIGSKQPWDILIAQTEGINLNKDEGITVFTAYDTKNGVIPFGNTMKCEVEVYSIPSLKQDFTKRYVLRIDPETHHCASFEEEGNDGQSL